MNLRHLLRPPGLMLLAAAALTPFATPADAQQNVAKCNNVQLTTATPAQLESVLSDADCYAKLGLSDLNSARSRISKALELAKQIKNPPVVTPIPPTPVVDPVDPALIKPITDNFSLDGLTYQGPIASDNGVDPVGAFRFICYPSHYNWDDSIIAPGVIGGSPHGHSNFGNTLGDGKSTYASLRTTGESTCHNKINRGHYWIPWMQRKDGKIIREDFFSLYYKRMKKTDPDCLKVSLKGCVNLPSGFRAIAGYNPAQYGLDQPQNSKLVHWSCNGVKGPDQVGLSRPTIKEALADCKLEKYGEVQILGTINFPACWNGLLDSADHRSHLADTSLQWPGVFKCPDTHPYIIPGLTETAAYSIRTEDGDVRLSCDVMGDKSLEPGSCLHGDYREAWSPVFLKKFQDNCIDKHLNCSYMNFGDGTFATPIPDTRGLPRVVDAPIRPVQIANTDSMAGMSH